MYTVTALDVFEIGENSQNVACFDYRRQTHDDDGNVKTVSGDYVESAFGRDQVIPKDTVQEFIADKCDNHGYTVHYAGVSDSGLYVTLTRSR